MNITVFSKNRAAQLELFIRSFKKYVKNADNYSIKIIYLYTEPRYEEGYNKLIEMGYPNIQYIKETNFKQDVINCININKKHTVYFVDDNIFKNYFDFYDEQMRIFNEDNEIVCRSLRLHPRLKYCYPMNNLPMTSPKFMDHNVFYWTGLEGDYGYPMSVDGHIFRTEQIYPYIIHTPYSSPTMFEGYMAAQPIRLPKMICYDKSIVVNNPCNKVQTVNGNIHGNIQISDLNERFLAGQLISLDNIDGIENISCHQEIEIKYQ
jgi:hypothetical protein